MEKTWKFWSGELDTQRVADLLKAARLRAGLTQKQAAGETGLQQSYISRTERGKMTFRFLDVLKLAEAYKLQSLADLYKATRQNQTLDRIIKRGFKVSWQKWGAISRNYRLHSRRASARSRCASPPGGAHPVLSG